jgi:hypothetical protein
MLLYQTCEMPQVDIVPLNTHKIEKRPKPGDYVIVHIKASTGRTLTGEAVGITSLSDWHTKLHQTEQQLPVLGAKLKQE